MYIHIYIYIYSTQYIYIYICIFVHDNDMYICMSVCTSHHMADHLPPIPAPGAESPAAENPCGFFSKGMIPETGEEHL